MASTHCPTSVHPQPRRPLPFFSGRGELQAGSRGDLARRLISHQADRPKFDFLKRIPDPSGQVSPKKKEGLSRARRWVQSLWGLSRVGGLNGASGVVASAFVNLYISGCLRIGLEFRKCRMLLGPRNSLSSQGQPVGTV